MSGATPFYGIRYPDGTTKVLNLGAELKQFALDFEAALRRETVFGNDVLADLYAVSQAVDGAVTPTENAMAAAAASPSSPLRQVLDQRYLDDTIPPDTNLNNYWVPGRKRGTNLSNAPAGDTGWWHYDIRVHQAGLYGTQTAYHFFDAASIYHRICNNGTWSPWRRLTTTA